LARHLICGNSDASQRAQASTGEASADMSGGICHSNTSISMSDDESMRTNARVLGADAKTGSTMRAALASVATERRIVVDVASGR
jgi:hypothetical protein